MARVNGLPPTRMMDVAQSLPQLEAMAERLYNTQVS